MKKNLILVTIFFTIFLDFFNLGLIYPIFTSFIFEGDGALIPADSSDFIKNTVFGFLVGAFPLGQFVGAPVIGRLSDRLGRRTVLLATLFCTIITLLNCAIGVLYGILFLVFFGRLFGGVMAGNMTLAYASLADFSTQEDKVRNFALIPLASGLGFAGGPYFAGILANPDTHSLAGPALPFFVATLLAVVNLVMVFVAFPETSTVKQGSVQTDDMSPLARVLKTLRNKSLRPYLWIFFLMISSNFVFVQFVGPFAIDRFNFTVTEVGYLYANIGIAVALGHTFLTRRLANWCACEQALVWSLSILGISLVLLIRSPNVTVLHILTFIVMLSCAVAYTNSMTLVSNHANKDQQGEIMGVAVSVQSLSEFLPAAILGTIAFLSQSIPLLAAAILAGLSLLILHRQKSIALS